MEPSSLEGLEGGSPSGSPLVDGPVSPSGKTNGLRGSRRFGVASGTGSMDASPMARVLRPGPGGAEMAGVRDGGGVRLIEEGWNVDRGNAINIEFN